MSDDVPSSAKSRCEVCGLPSVLGAPLADHEKKWGYRTKNHAFELVFLIVASLVSVPLVFGAIPPPASTASFLTGDLLVIWSWMLLLGSIVGLSGLLWLGRQVTAMVLEQVGLILLSGAVLLYVAGTVYNVTFDRAVPIVINFAFGVACVVRVFQLGGEIRGLVARSMQFMGTLDNEQQVRDHFQEQDERGEPHE